MVFLGDLVFFGAIAYALWFLLYISSPVSPTLFVRTYKRKRAVIEHVARTDKHR